MKQPEEFTQKLLVEGNDDLHVVKALCIKYTVTKNFEIVDCGSIEKVFNQLDTRLKLKDTNTTIGIIVDADDKLQARWNSISNRLTKFGFIVPETIPNGGLVLNHNDVRVGVWIMPNNVLNGMLENFIAFLVPKEDKLLDIARTTLADIEVKNLQQYAAVHKSKALIHTWLAWQENPGTPMGQAITKKYLNADEETSLLFVNWLKETFS